MVDINLIPTVKEKNIFWSSVEMSAIVSLVGAFFVSSFFYLSTKYFNYGFWLHFFLFLDSGVGLLLIIFHARKKIIFIK